MSDGVKKINEWIMKDGRVLAITRNIDPNKLEGGTQYINPNSGLLNYVNVSSAGLKAWKKYDPMTIFEAQSIKTNLIANLNVTTEKLADSAVTTSKLANLNVTTEKLANLNTTTEKLADNAVTNIKIDNNAITRTKIMDYEVVLSKLADSSVNADKIVPLSIINSNIAEGTITRTKFVPKTLSNLEIANDTLVESLFKNNSVSTRIITDRNVIGSKIALKCLLREHISSKSIGSVEIDEEVISTVHVLSLDAIKLVNKSIVEIKMSDNSISNRALIDGSVSFNKFDANLQDLSNRTVRIEREQVIDNERYVNTAWIQGSLILKNIAAGNVNLKVHGDIVATGTVTATKCYNPVFADLAEAYIPTEKFEAGDAVSLSLEGGLKIEKLTKDNANRFLGFISDEYATVFGASADELKSGRKVAVTLIGRIKIKATGTAKIGDFVFIINGEPKFYESKCDSACGRVLENKSNTDQYVLCQLWP